MITPSALLREVVSRLGPEEADQQRLIQIVSEAFCFTEGQAYLIFGWFPDGTGELKDTDIDYLLSKRIERTRHLWEQMPSSSP